MGIQIKEIPDSFPKKRRKILGPLARYLLKNGSGKKIILCDRTAAPSAVNLGESIISFN